MSEEEVSGPTQPRESVTLEEEVLKRWRDLDIPVSQKQDMTLTLQDLAGTAEGLFAIIDYYNFKGLGINPRDGYPQQQSKYNR